MKAVLGLVFLGGGFFLGYMVLSGKITALGSTSATSSSAPLIPGSAFNNRSRDQNAPQLSSLTPAERRLAQLNGAGGGPLGIAGSVQATGIGASGGTFL